MLSRILDGTREPDLARRRVTRRRLVFAGLPSLAAAVAAVVIAVAVTRSGPAPGPLTPDTVRTAVLDALQQDSGDILQASVEYQDLGAAAESTRSTWVYPAFPAVGQQVRFREVDYRQGKPSQDVESVYTEDEALEHTSMSTTQGPGSAKIVGVDYPTRTWATFTTSAPLVDLTVSPALIRSEIASGNFTVDGTVKILDLGLALLHQPQQVSDAASRSGVVGRAGVVASTVSAWLAVLAGLPAWSATLAVTV